MCNNSVKRLGFTLVELMITLAITGILMSVGIPSFNSMISSTRLTSYANEFVTALNLARSEAVKRGVSVTVRKVDNYSSTKKGAEVNWEDGRDVNWEDGWNVFTDANSDGKFDTGTDVLIKTFAPLQSSYTLQGNGSIFPDYILFKSSGQSNTLGGSFVICNDSDGLAVPKANTSRLIIVNATGRVRMGLDANNDGIPNTNSTATAASNITSCTPPFS
jgi:type IV fimbrial biogenesis protein FimT